MPKKFLFLLILIFFVATTLRSPVDLDLGWHLRYGEHFFKTGQVLKENIISFVWPDYQWVQASWGYDLLVYQIFQNFSFLGLSLTGSIITLLIFLLITYPIKRFGFFALLFLATIFLTQTLLLYATGIRSQTLSGLFFALTLLIIHKKGKWYYCLPVLFFIWSNMHGGFALGLILLSIIWLFSLRIMPKKEWAILGLMLSLSFITPVINPWGLKTYEESFKHTSNLNLTIITEWQPLTQSLPETAIASLVFLFTMAVGFLSKQRQANIPYLIALLVTFYLALSALRFTIIFGIMATYILSQNIYLAKLPALKFKFLSFMHYIPKALLIIFIALDLFYLNRYLSIPNPNIINFSWKSYCDFFYDCSEEVTKAMLKNPPKGVGYNTYNYGGYLSWRVPQVKTFVDGRMAAWEKDGQTPPIVLANQVITANTPIPFKTLDNEYHFSFVVTLTPSATAKYLDNLINTGNWKRLYQDEIYSYYIKVDK